MRHPDQTGGRAGRKLRALAGLVLVAATALLPAPARAILPDFGYPASRTADRTTPLASYALPVGPWAEGGGDLRLLEGRLRETTWRIEAADISTLKIFAPLRAAVQDQGFGILYECEATACGGFDFRFAMQVIPAPAMHVDLGDFRYLAAVSGSGAGAEHLGILVSRSSRAGFVQIVQVWPAAAPPSGTPGFGGDITPATPFALGPGLGASPALSDATGIGAALEQGAAPLDDLVFARGAAALEPGRFASLEALAGYLRGNPGRSITLVGHTDASGALAPNIALSRRRAEAVRDRLISDHGIAPDRLQAEGVGYLAPRASNLTEEGQRLNRRVEAILDTIR